ncbi:hypothetical protein CEXT_112582 [Caerostris extrusa]|uniref:Serpin domain-containing protein n=1 Tax=Caerostris extrusa TaxID=172846 RepID=A0AAV4NTM7_CAEEX|nr:hypothetical protein CEXT_112582 [Caerostris extrusa]
MTLERQTKPNLVPIRWTFDMISISFVIYRIKLVHKFNALSIQPFSEELLKMYFRKFLISTLLIGVATGHMPNTELSGDSVHFSLHKLSEAVNTFGFNLFSSMRRIGTSSNVCLCPVSLVNVLSILHYGARGETEKELSKVLFFNDYNLTSTEAAEAFYKLQTELLVSSNHNHYFFNASATILIDEHSNVLQSFQRTVEVLFQIPLTVVNFKDSAQRTVESINTWVAERTRIKILEIIDKIDESADMIVLNAAYFKGRWVHTFSPSDTTYKFFYNYGSRSHLKKVPMMSLTKRLRCYFTHDYSILEIPIRGRNLSMVIYLPSTKEGLFNVENILFPEVFWDNMNLLHRRQVKVTLPRFNFEFHGNLTENLLHLGAKTLFDSHSVNLSGMMSRKRVIFRDVQHKAFLSVSEGGIDAMPPRNSISHKIFAEKYDILFEVDHPFIFFIYDKRLSMILFMGHITEV